MKKHLVLKTTLALGILATGGIVAQQDIQADTVSQSQKANEAEKAHKLEAYYKQKAFDPAFVKGRKDRHQHVIEFVVGQVDYEVEVSKEVYESYVNYKPVHVFLVKEDGNREWERSIGGVTKVNNRADTGKHIHLDIKGSKSTTSLYFYTGKDEISLKEVDFRLRQDLIKHHHLYKDGELNKGTIKVTVGSEVHTIKLDEKLSKDDMNKTIDATQIKSIEVDLKNN